MKTVKGSKSSPFFPSQTQSFTSALRGRAAPNLPFKLDRQPDDLDTSALRFSIPAFDLAVLHSSTRQFQRPMLLTLLVPFILFSTSLCLELLSLADCSTISHPFVSFDIDPIRSTILNAIYQSQREGTYKQGSKATGSSGRLVGSSRSKSR